MCGTRFYSHQLPPGAGAAPRLLAPVCGARMYRVRSLCMGGEFSTITQALSQWNADKSGPDHPRVAIIEIADSATYHEAPHIIMEPGEHLQLRAANMAHPALRVVDCHGRAPGQLRISGAPGSAFTLDGVLVHGGPLAIDDASRLPPAHSHERFSITLRHCTLVPGGDASFTGAAPWRGKASVVLHAQRAGLRIEHSIAGPLHVARHGSLLSLQVNDSIIDAGHEAGLAVSDDAHGSAFARVGILRSTIIGVVQVEELSAAGESVFLGPLLAVRRDTGRVRSCYLAQGSRTPPRAGGLPEGLGCPPYLSLRYGTPGYCQLGPHFDDEDGEDDGIDGVCNDHPETVRSQRHAAAPFL